MSTTASRPPRSGAGAWKAGLLIVLLLLAAWQTTGPWGELWILVPLVTALSLLTAWRFGGWATLLPVVAFGISVATFPLDPLWVGWLPAVALVGVWMGLREEAGSTAAGERAWMLIPILIVAASLPWAPTYRRAVDVVSSEMRDADSQVMAFYRQVGMSGERLHRMEQAFTESTALRERALPHALPTLIFLWMATLVFIGRSLAARAALIARWPRLTRAHLAGWRLPDGALWVFLLGLGLMVARLPDWTSTAWTLTANAALGYCLQGMAVVQSLLLTRGFSPYMIAALMAFVLVMAWPAFLLLAACVGLSDVWLDYRRLERTPHEQQP